MTARRLARSRGLARAGAVALATLAPSGARGAPPEPPASAVTPPPERAREEARQRFDRGLALYNSGDMPGALAEFQRAYRITKNPVVLYNLALVQANVGDAALAVTALEELQRTGWAGLGADRAVRADAVYREQLLRVGTLAIQADVQGALVLIDNVDAARTPAPPQRVTAGKHIVALSAPGYEPQRLAVTVAGQAREEIAITLVPLEEALAHLALSSNVPDVTVKLDGQPLGRTPFPTEMAFKPGKHELEWARDGYVTVRRSVVLQPGTRGEMSVPMVASDAGLALGGSLAFHLSEPNTVVTVDRQPTLDHTRGLRLAAGRHTIRIQRAGFFDVDRDVVMTPGANALDVRLLPTPEYLGEYVGRAERMRLVSYVTLGAGALAAGGGVAFLLWNQGKKNAAETKFHDFASDVERNPNGTCPTDSCVQSAKILAEDLEAKRDRDVYGWIGVGVGAAALGTGVLLFAIGEDPDRYAPKPESDVFGAVGVRASVGSVDVSGAF